MGSKAAKPTLADRLKSETVPEDTRRRWYHRLSPEQMAELEAVRTAYKDGQLVGWNHSQLYRRVKDELGLTIALQAFVRFMNAYRS